MIRKRGQAAMEFLMTYGWAILAAIIVVGVLWYIIGSPGNLAGNRFTLSQPFDPEGMAISAAPVPGNIQIEFRNGVGDAVTISNIEIEGCTNSATDTFADVGPVADGTLTGALTVACDGTALTSDTRFNGDVTVYFTAGAGGITQQASGTISGRVP